MSYINLILDDFEVYASVLDDINSLIAILIKQGYEREQPYPLNQLSGIQYALESLANDLKETGKGWQIRINNQ